VRGKTRTFWLDQVPSQWQAVESVSAVVASWTDPRVDEAGHIRVEPPRAVLQPLEQALPTWDPAVTRRWSDSLLHLPSDQFRVQDRESIRQVLRSAQGERVANEDPWEDLWLPTAVGLPQQEYEHTLDPSYLRLGYVSILLGNPVEDLQISSTVPLKQIQTLRSRSPLMKGNWGKQTQVTLNLTFYGEESLRQILLPLVRLFKRVPFLPVYNQLLNDQGIGALSLAELQVATAPGFPNLLKVQLTCYAFNWAGLFPNVENMDLLYCYPLLKLWAERPWNWENNPGVQQFKPFSGSWNGKFQLYHLSQRWLEEYRDYASEQSAAEAWNQTVRAAQGALRIERRRPVTGSSPLLNPDGSLKKLVTGVPGLTLDSPLTQGIIAAEQGDTGIPVSQNFVPDPASPTRDGQLNSTRFLASYADYGRLRMAFGDVDTLRPTFETFGVELSADRHYDMVFLRTHSVEAAQRLARRDGLVAIIQGPVKAKLTGHTQLRDAVREGRETSRNPERLLIWQPTEWSIVARDQVLNLVPGVRVVLQQGSGLTFVFAQGDPALSDLAGEGLKALKDPGDPALDLADPGVPDSLVVEQITSSLSNILAPQQIRGEQQPSFQYLGSTATVYRLNGTVGRDDAAQVTQFLERVTTLARKFPGRLDGSPFAGYCVVGNELCQYLGTRNVIPLSWDVATIPSFPDRLRWELTLIEYDETSRSREALKDLNEHLGTDPFLNQESQVDAANLRVHRVQAFHQRLAGTELYPDLRLPRMHTLRKWFDDILNDEVWDWEKGEGKVHGGDPDRDYRYLDRPFGGTGWQWYSTQKPPAAHLKDRAGNPRVMALPRAFRLLKPPRVAPSGQVQRFAEPDFFCQPSHAWGRKLVDDLVTGAQATEFVLQDRYGAGLAGVRPGTTGAQAYGDARNHRGNLKAQMEKLEAKEREIRPRGGHVEPEGLVYNSLQGGSGAYAGQSAQADGTTAEKLLGKKGWARLHQQSWYSSVDRMWDQVGVPTFAWAHNVLRESGGHFDAQDGTGALGIYQFDPTGVLKTLTAQLGADRARAIARDPELATQTFIRLERAAIQRAVQEAAGDPYKLAYLFTKYVERPAAQHVQEVYRELSPYFGQEAVEAAQQQTVNQWVAQLEAAFNRGEAFRRSDIEAWRLGGPNPQGFVRRQPDDWMRPLTVVVQSASVDGGSVDTGEDPDRLVVKKEYLPAFVREWLRHSQPFQLQSQAEQRSPFANVFADNYTAAEETRLGALPESPQSAFFNAGTGQDMFHDLRRELTVGRLVACFPTFYVAIIDGGRAMRVWRLFDHVYGMMAVTSINVHRTMDGPVETALVSFANMFGHLTGQAYDMARLQEQDLRTEVWTSEVFMRWYNNLVRFDAETVAIWAQHRNSLMLKPGARLHIRLGYGSDANQLPVVFNGVISQTGPQEGEVQVVALSDGIELLNELPPTDYKNNVPLYVKNSWFGDGVNPRELILYHLFPDKDTWSHFFDNVGNSLATEAGQNGAPILYGNVYKNAYGIEHFGYPLRNFLSRTDGEIGINLYNPEFSTKPFNQSWAWDNAFRWAQILKWDRHDKLLGVAIPNGRPWDVFEACRKAVPDYNLYVVPVELRSTLFYGKSWFTLHGNYRDEIDRLDEKGDPLALPGTYFHRKTFTQLHLASSEWNLIGLDVQADDSEVKTQCQAIGTFNGWAPGNWDMNAEVSDLMQVDSDIFQEKQRLINIQSNLYSTAGMKLTALPTDFTGLWRSRRVLNHVAAMTLKDGIRKMYRGPLVLQGSGWIKPYDYMVVADRLSGLNGLCEVREVIQSFGADTGYITEVTPACLSVYVDEDGKDLILWAAMVGGHLSTALCMAKLVGHLSRPLAFERATGAVRKLLTWIETEAGKQTVAGLSRNGVSPAELRVFEQQLRGDLAATTRTRGTGQLLRDLLGNATYAKLKVPQHLNSELKLHYNWPRFVQTVQRGGNWTKGYVRDVLDHRLDVQRDAHLDLDLDLKEAQAERDLVLRNHNLAEKELGAIKRRVKEGVQLTQAEAEVWAAEQKFQDAQALFKQGSKGIQRLENLRELGSDSLRLLKLASSELMAMSVITAGIYLISTGIGDYLRRSAMARQCLIIYPLRIWDKELTAGLEGHRGAVAGDPVGTLDHFLGTAHKFLTENPYGIATSVAAGFVPILGDIVSALADSPDYRHPAPDPILTIRDR
jgi:hypothetical protein